MALELPKPPIGYAEYAAIDDGNRYQLIEGELFMTPSPSQRHQRVLGQLYGAFFVHLREHGGGDVFFAPFDVVLKASKPGTVVQPDLMFISNERHERLTEANVQGAPDLVVEVLSPSNARLDTIRKLAIYAASGVREYWIVPDDFDRVEVLRRAPDGGFQRPELYLPGDVLQTDLLPGLAIPVESLFELEDQQNDRK